jgi:head-tail adaptor
MNERWGEVTTKFILRYSSLVTVQCRIFDHTESKEYDIKSVIDINDERRGLEILAQRID